MSLCDNSGSKAAPFAWQELPVHTQPFTFRAPQEDDESVKMSNIASRRASAVTPALLATRPRLKHAQKHQFLFDTNERFSSTTNFATNRNQSTSLFLFDTNDQSPIPNHQSLLTKTRRIP
jgi:hypothetical protein